jgi:hypothetical protein
VTRDDWRRVEPTLTQALLLPERDRDELIDSVVLDDAVRRRIMEVLRQSSTRTPSVAAAGSATPPGAGSRTPSGGIASSPGVPVLSPGDSLEGRRFVVVRQIGRGGMADVYLAQDTTLGTLVGLKVLPSDEQLIREAQRAAICSDHPNVVTVHNVLRTSFNDQPIGVLVMDYVAGTPASKLLDDGPVAVTRALRWMREVAAAVAHAHDRNVLHCDLKPANVLITPDDHAMVLDFGIARATFDASNDAEPLRGTMPYMAPEQLLAREFSPAGDIYSLGVTLFELVTGRRPFDGDDVMLRLQIIAADPPKMSELASGVTPEIDAIVERALAKDPDTRFRSARAFERALERQDPAATATVPIEVPDRAAQRRSTLAAFWKYVAAAVAVLLALSATLGFIASRGFEVVLRIDSDFSATPADYFRIGTAALVPFVAYWIVAAAALVGAAGLRMLLEWGIKKEWTKWSQWWGQLNPNALAVGTFLAGAASWFVLVWTHAPIFSALFDLHERPLNASVDMISYASRSTHLTYAIYSAYLSFFLIAAALLWFPRLQRRRTDSLTVKVMSAATLIVAFLTMAGPTLPRRFLFERFRVVEYQGRDALVIGSAGDELLLYDAIRRQSLRVRRDNPNVATKEGTQPLFPG